MDIWKVNCELVNIEALCSFKMQLPMHHKQQNK